jgi:phosphoglycolate phosphatase-like HAD superfamily hydrolase
MKLSDYLKKNPKKQIIFDLDGTLADLHIDWEGYREGLYELVGNFDKQIVADMPKVKGIASNFYNRVIIKHGVEAKRKLDEYADNWELTKFTGYKPNNTLIEFIHGQADKYRFHVWTSQNMSLAKKMVEDLAIADKINQLIPKEKVELLKPIPDGFNKINQEVKAELADYLMIGDSESDKGAAENAGIDFLHVNEIDNEKNR